MRTTEQVVINRILTRTAEYKASDLHLSIGNPPIVRVDGKLKALQGEKILTPDFIAQVAYSFLSEEQREILESEKEIVLTYAFQNKARFKINIFYQKGYLNISLRLIPDQIPDLKSLNLPENVNQFAMLTRGLVLVTGPFGSGRTTTAFSLVNEINKTRAEHIVTIEKPIEYLIVNDKSIVEQREVGRDTKSFEQALGLTLKEDVNVVLVSEMDKPSVISTALGVADSGRLVIGLMNTDSVVKTIERIIESFSADEQIGIRGKLADNLQGVLTQRLIPKVGGGRVAVAEVLMPSPAVGTVIKDGAISQLNNILQTSREEGMISLDHSLAELVKSGEIAQEDALKYASDKNNLKTIISGGSRATADDFRY
ncbi:MAG: PilT/PilU family type 4a pilus ATPase [Patescibacteria group bacterium]